MKAKYAWLNRKVDIQTYKCYIKYKMEKMKHLLDVIKLKNIEEF